MIGFTTPELAAQYDAARFMQDEDYDQDKVEELAMGTWLAAQASLEISGKPTFESITAYVRDAVELTPLQDVCVQAAADDIEDGRYGRIIPQELYGRLQNVLGHMLSGATVAKSGEVGWEDVVRPIPSGFTYRPRAEFDADQRARDPEGFDERAAMLGGLLDQNARYHRTALHGIRDEPLG